MSEGDIEIFKIHRDLNVADPLTKPLPRAKHDQHQRSMGVSTTKKYTSVMIRVCHSRSRFVSCMYIHDKFMTESR